MTHRLLWLPGLLLFCLSGCATAWDINQRTVQHRTTEINRPLTVSEQAWMKGLFEARLKVMQSSSDKWTLLQSSYSFVQEGTPATEDKILGLRFRFVFTGVSNKTITLYQFINPIRLHFNEIGIGHYSFIHYNYPAVFILKSSGAYLFDDRWDVPFLDLDEADRNFFKNKQVFVANGYIGKSWTAELGAPGTDFRDRCSFSLEYRPASWRSEDHGEYWLAGSEDKASGDELISDLYSRIEPEPPR
jgi:hypothetical protein